MFFDIPAILFLNSITILDSYGEYSIDGFIRFLLPRCPYAEDYIEGVPYIKEYRIINHLSIAPTVYKEPLVLGVARNKCRYNLEGIAQINHPDFLDILVQVIVSTDKYCEEMTAIVMDCKVEEAERDYVPQIKWGVIVNSVNKTAMLIDRESAAVQFHKRFRLIKYTFLK